MERSWKFMIELTITTVMGTSFKIRMQPHETVIDIKRRIYHREGIPVDKQHLIWKLVELQDKLKLSDYGMQSGATLQLVTAMRGGPLNVRRVPAVDNNQWLRLLADDDAPPPNGRPVAVIVLQDGTELHFFQFIDDSQEASIDDDDSDGESDVKSEDPPEVRERKEANARTRATMAALRHKMDQNKAKAAALRRSQTKSPSGKTTINRRSATKLQGANIPVVIGRSAISTTRSSTLPDKPEKKRSGGSVTSSKRYRGSAEHQNRNDAGGKSSSGDEFGASSTSIWARLLASSSKLSVDGLDRSTASLRTAFYPDTHVAGMVKSDESPTGESSKSSIWLRRVQGRGEVSRTGSGRLIGTQGSPTGHSPSVIKGRANKNTAASGVIQSSAGRQSPRKSDNCSYCTRRLGLTATFQCRCGGTYCAAHRYPEAHRCTYDYKTKGREILEKENPKVIAEKLPKL